MNKQIQHKINLFDIQIDNSSWPIFDSLLSIDRIPPPQLLKWIGNKQRFAEIISKTFPNEFRCYFEPFVGSGAVLGAISPKIGVAGDVLKPLVDLWKLLQENPDRLFLHYKKNWEAYIESPKETYVRVLADYNNSPNPEDFLFISRSCYGGVIRFTKAGKMSTPIGPHTPISPESLRDRMVLWRNRVKGTNFIHGSFEQTMSEAGDGDIVYCDPPYVDSQAILYGAQSFDINKLWKAIDGCKKRGAKVALSIDGRKKSGAKVVELNMPTDLFKRQLFINNGSSMLKRFQKKDETMIGEDVHDRLLLTW